jgi:hypothetical protein
MEFLFEIATSGKCCKQFTAVTYSRSKICLISHCMHAFFQAVHSTQKYFQNDPTYFVIEISFYECKLLIALATGQPISVFHIKFERHKVAKNCDSLRY